MLEKSPKGNGREGVREGLGSTFINMGETVKKKIGRGKKIKK